MAYEAMNNAGARDERLIVILNDNDMSIAPPTGALSAYLARVTSCGSYLYVRDIAKQLRSACRRVGSAARRASKNTRGTCGKAAPGSRSWASIMSDPSTGTISTSFCRY